MNEGECYVVLKGIEHMPEAYEEAHIMMFEPKQTAHTGTTKSELSVKVNDQNWL